MREQLQAQFEPGSAAWPTAFADLVLRSAANIERKVGTTLAQIRAAVGDRTERGETRACVVEVLGIGRSDSGALAHAVTDVETPEAGLPAEIAEQVNDINAEKKACPHPIHGKLMAALSGFCPFEIASKKSYIGRISEAKCKAAFEWKQATKIFLSTALLPLLVGCGPNENAGSTAADSHASAAQTVAFYNGPLELHGFLYKPEGSGPFPVVLFNHGSAAGLLNNQAFDAIAPIFIERGWAFFAPYRRGQGLSQTAGPYIMDEIAAARRRGGLPEADKAMTRLLSNEHLSDQLAAFAWLRTQPFVQTDAIAVMGNSFGGIEALLGATRAEYCAAVDAAGGAESWDDAPALRDLLTQSVQAAPMPVFFFQAENDVSVAPSQILFAIRQRSGLPSELHIYPAFGRSKRDGHSFPYRGVSVWSADVLRFLDQHCIR
ncbi:MAG: alpha/beta hydrolase family protein [Devosia sp.]